MNLDEIDFQIEVIAQDEVTRIVAALNELRSTVASVIIREFLEECSTDIYYLVNDDETGVHTAAA